MVALSNSSFLSSKWASRFLQSAIIQGAVITFLTVLFISIQLLLSSSVNIVQFLSLSFEGPAKWIFLGYIFYMILIVSIATTSVFYNQLEVYATNYSWLRIGASMGSSNRNERRRSNCHSNYDICRISRIRNYWDNRERWK